MLTLPQTGIDLLLEDLGVMGDKRVGLFANQTSKTAKSIPTAVALQGRLGPSLTCLFTPEHGWMANESEGKAIENTTDSSTNLTVYSLYGPLLERNLEALKNIDILIIDIQDVGVRCYTYAATCAKVLSYISKEKLPLQVIICDRPNPLGTAVKGERPQNPFSSIVSYLDVPFQHGKTLGELLQLYNQSLDSPGSLTILNTGEAFNPQLHAWIPPSPGLPDWESVFLYPGLVLLEGTNISEGRGTDFPFKCLGAPGMDAKLLIAQLGLESAAHPYSFTPIRSKFKGGPCDGILFQGRVEDSYTLGLRLLTVLPQIYPAFEWILNGEKYWIDELLGRPDFRQEIGKI